ncbi:MAG: Rho termination factor N-terminal domain-containing protein [Bacilli bacterium]
MKVEKTVETKKEAKADVNLDSLSLAELKDMAKDKGIKGYSTLKKNELIEKLK